jgi:hypothetical protein
MQLTLHVLEAAGLSYLNQHDNIYPYCLVQLSQSSQIQRTKVIQGATSPVWNANFSFDVRHPKESLKIFVKDSSKLQSHAVLATVTVALGQYGCGTTVDQWFKLTPVKGVKIGGQIHLMLRLDSGKPLASPRSPRSPRAVGSPSSPRAVRPVTEKEREVILASPKVIDVMPIVLSPVTDTNTKPRVEILKISGDFGEIIDAVNPNTVGAVETSFSGVRESPGKMYAADAMEQLQLEKDRPIYGPHWALAKIAAFSAHRGCDYFTDFACSGCEASTKAWVLAMKSFFGESNHDINRNRIQFRKDARIGPLINAVFKAYDVTIAAMARKETLVQARNAINEASKMINDIAGGPADHEDYLKVEGSLLKGCQNARDREDGTFWTNLQGAKLDSLGANAAISALGLSSLEHSLNCCICNSLGSRIQVENKGRQSICPAQQKLRAVASAPSIQANLVRYFGEQS